MYILKCNNPKKYIYTYIHIKTPKNVPMKSLRLLGA